MASALATPRLQEINIWQAGRLARTYDDLRRDARYATGVEFFLIDLCGPWSDRRRDTDFNRAFSRLKQALPGPALALLTDALELQVLSTQLDQEMARHLAPGPLTDASYADAYRTVGGPEARRRQISLVVGIGNALTRVVSFPGIGLAVRAARIPAYIAGFSALHDFLERGFDAFRQVADVPYLLAAIQARETRFVNTLFAGGKPV